MPPQSPAAEDSRFAVDTGADGPWVDPGFGGEQAPLEELPPPRRSRGGRRQRPARAESGGATRARPQLPTVKLPTGALRAGLFDDPVSVAFLGVAVVSAVIMAGVLIGRNGSLPDELVLRYDAVGAPSRFGPPKSLWQLPLLAAMVTVINLALAIYLRRYDRFAPRVLLGSAIVVGLLAWIPLVRFLW